MKTRYVRIALLFLLAGCRNNTGNDALAPQKKATKVDDDKTPIALAIFRQGTELPQFREALNLLSPNLARPDVMARVTLKPDDRIFLETEAKLSPAELQ